MPSEPLVRFANAMWWEFFQNVWGAVLFVAAVWFWAHQNKGQALVCMVTGGVATALAIYVTEAIKSGHGETVAILAANLVSMIVLQLLIVPYLGSETRWSNLKMDSLVGVLAGVGLAVAQKLADPASPWIGVALHALALGVASAVILINVRKLKSKTLRGALSGGFLIAIVMTAIIGLIDYAYLVLPDGLVKQIVSPGGTP